MNMKDLTKEVAYKMRKIRQSLRLSNSQMAAKLGVERSTYNRNEEGRTLPGISTLLKLGNYYDISLDWLLRNKGPMYCKEKIVEKEKEIKIEEPKPDPFAKVLETLGNEAKDTALKLATTLRHGGTNIILATGSRSLKAQLRQANNLNIPKVAIIGDDEVKAGTVVLRDMASSQQETVPLAKLQELLR